VGAGGRADGLLASARAGIIRRMDDVIRERTTEEKLDEVIRLVAEITVRVERIERVLLPQEPDPEIGLP
jgi:hypothetical protein